MTVKQGQGDLEIADVIQLDRSKATTLFRQRFVRYQTLTKKLGERDAYEVMMKNYPQQQKALMGTFIDRSTLAEGFTKAIPLLGLMGFETEVIDVSQSDTDAALEVQKVCPFMELAQEYAVDSPCKIFCEMEQEAARRAFTDLKAEILSTQHSGSCVCVFKYERPTKSEIKSKAAAKRTKPRLLRFFLLVPTIAKVGFRMLKLKLSS